MRAPRVRMQDAAVKAMPEAFRDAATQQASPRRRNLLVARVLPFARQNCPTRSSRFDPASRGPCGRVARVATRRPGSFFSILLVPRPGNSMSFAPAACGRGSEPRRGALGVARAGLAVADQTRDAIRCRKHRARLATPSAAAMSARPPGSGGAGSPAVLPRLDDGTASPASRRLAGNPAALGTQPPWLPGGAPNASRASPRKGQGGSRCRKHRARDATPPSFAMRWRPSGSGGAGQSAAPPRRGPRESRDGTASPSSRRLTAYPAARRTNVTLFPGRGT